MRAVYLATGMRFSDVANVDAPGFDRVTGESRAVGKGNKGLWARLGPSTMREVRAYVERRSEDATSERLRLTEDGLISAPAGFGKTTLISEWLAGCDRQSVWLSLDEGDGDPIRFLTFLVTALRTVAAGIGEGELGVLQSPQPPPTEAILTALINEITTLPDSFVLVLDDYHAIDAKPVDRALTFVLEHLPPQMHLVIATREDPHLPLARLRVQGQLTELRVTELRFTPSEAAEFLNRVMGPNLSEEDIAALEVRIEGWISGLQLAAISMQGHQDATSSVEHAIPNGLAGSLRSPNPPPDWGGHNSAIDPAK